MLLILCPVFVVWLISQINVLATFGIRKGTTT